MAFLARHHGMAPDQRKSSDVVIEGSYASPSGFVVTLLAAASKLAVMPVIFAMARHTGGRQLVAIEIARMARVALDLRVSGSEGVFCLPVVIEADRHPLVLIVAAIALAAISSGVNVLNPVAINTCGANPLVALADVARRTDDGAMGALKRKPGLVVVERLDASPHRLRMTAFAFIAEASFVGIVRLMAIVAAPGRVAKLHSLRVAAAALHRFVGVAELEIRESVIECFAVEQDDVGFPALMIGVAVGAVPLCGIRLPSVKSPTRQPIRGRFLVACEAQPRLGFS